jgi:ribose-phosphate pyrophosphokinase
MRDGGFLICDNNQSTLCLPMNKCILFCGNSSQRLGRQIVKADCGIEYGAVDHKMFPSGEWYCQLKENVRGADVFLLNSITKPANDALMQLLIMADAARRASAWRITAVIPYMGYSRQDRKDKSRVPISAKLVLDIMEASGIQRVLTMDMHAPQIQGFTNLPFDHLQFRPALLNALQQFKIDVVVAPDVGAIKRAEEYARYLDADLAIISKLRRNALDVEAQHFIGDVQGKQVLMVDDLTESAGTLVEAAKQCRKHGAVRVYAAVSHGCITEVGNKRLVEAFRDGIIDIFWMSNSVESDIPFQWADTTREAEPGLYEGYENHVSYVNVAPTFARAIYAIHHNESISSLFN